MNQKPIKWAAKLSGVRDVTLIGQANLSYWEERLKGDNLVPVDRGGYAEILVIAANAKYMGIKFREISFSVRVTDRNAPETGEGAYLWQAYLSSSLLGWCERTFFSTPYDEEECDVRTALPPKIRISRQDMELFHAEMESFEGHDPRESIRSGVEGWEGRVYLPNLSSRRSPVEKWFQAKVQGETKAYSFDPAKDILGIDASRQCPPLRVLVDCGFAATEWQVRHNAEHWKSKTYRRNS